MRRPLCCVCIAFVVAVFIYLTLFPDVDKCIYYDNEEKECSGEVYYKQYKNGIYTIYIKTEKERVMVTLDKDSTVPMLGSNVTMKGNVQNFTVARNPGGFDAREYYRLQGITYMLKGATVQKQGKEYSRYKESLNRIKTQASRAYDYAVASGNVIDEKDAAIVKAMVLGDKTELDVEDKNLFQRSGMAHVLAISGLHISILGFGIYNLLRKLGIHNILATSLSVVVMIMYGDMVGMPNSAYRAIFMFGLRMLAVACKRSYDMLTALAISAVTLLIEQPLYVFSSGFLLSFGAILGISGLSDMIKADTTQISFNQKTNTRLSIQVKRYLLRIQETLCASLSIFLIHFPIMLINYYEFPIYSFLLNMLIIPTVGILMITGLLGICISWLLLAVSQGILARVEILTNIGNIMTDMSGIICSYIIMFYEKLCNISLGLPGADWIVGRPDNWKIVVFYLVVLFLYALHRINVERYDSKLCFPFQIKMICIILSVAFISRQTHGELKITFMDVGQGDGIWIETDTGHHYLIDSGSASNKNLGKYTLIPYLKYTGTSYIDAVIISHLDTDHMSGIQELLKTEHGIEVGRVIISKANIRDEKYEELLSLCSQQEIPVCLVQEGDNIRDGDLNLKVLHPSTDYFSESRNAYSIVIQLEYKGFHALFAGDIEEEGERIIAEELRENNWTCHLYKASHHGSKYSNTEELLQVIKPKLTVVSSGKNSYGHPHSETLERLDYIGSQVIRTDQNGAVMLRICDGKMKVRNYIKLTE